jgi:ATP-dependent helicase HrpB
MVGGRGVRLDASSIVRESPLFLALDPREDDRARNRELRVRLASAIRPEWLETLYAGAVMRERIVRIDEERGRVVGAVVERYGDLVLREAPHAAVDPAEGTALLAAWLNPRLVETVRRDEDAAALLDRIESLRGWRPDLGLPAFDADALAALLREDAPGTLSVADLERLPWPSLLKTRLGRHLVQQLDTLAPEAIPVPTGNRIRLKYEPGRPPVLAVRLQELFGMRETPRVAGGQVAVLLHLLGPNYRPVQVTSDLSSFWANTYAQVRKDLRARYPKHAWPDDPLTAKPEAKGGRRSG